MIRVENLRKSYGSVCALNGVSFEAPDGAVTGLLGHNGAGKTTTLRMISSLIKPDAGRVLVDDIDAHADPKTALRRLGVLPEGRGLYPRLTTREHLLYAGRLHRTDERALHRRIETLIGELDMGSIIDRRVQGFSQGERTKVAIGRAIIHNPNNVVLDEATNGLDIHSARALREVIRRLAAEGRCVLFSNHVMQEVAALCDRIVVFRQGTVLASGTPAELKARAGTSNLEDAFVQLIQTEEAEA